MRPPSSAASSSKRRTRGSYPIGWTSLTILSVLAASPEPVVKMATLSLAACNSSSTSPTNQSCECFSGPAPIAPPGSRRSIGSRNRQGSPSRSGRTGRPEPTPRRDSLIQRVRSRAGRTCWRRGENSSSQTRRSCAQPKRPRRMGRCGEVADDGEKSGGPPRPRNRYVCRKAPFQRNSRRAVEPFAIRPDLFLPGTLHHSGNRPAPPSEHTPLERRSAF
jgi:hypothetical protein